MSVARVIPVLLLQNKGLVKTERFTNPKYVGDPINAVRIFNEKEVDELIFLDIDATDQKREPPYETIKSIATECFMPFCYGGGISTLAQAEKILALGAEKISVNSAVINNPELINEIAKRYGAQSVVVSIDVKKTFFGKRYIHINRGKQNTMLSAVELARQVADRGAGEILINSIERDGTQTGYDLDLIKEVSSAVSIPVVACGGAGNIQHFKDAIQKAGASAVAAGSMFVFYGKHRAVLINFPKRDDIDRELVVGAGVAAPRFSM